MLEVENLPRQEYTFILLRSWQKGLNTTSPWVVELRDGSSYHESIEEFDADTLNWKPVSPALLERRDQYGAVALERSLVC